MAPPFIFIPIGDSYTAGTGASPEEAWPAVLVEALRKEGIAISMPSNPARNGWTSRQAIELELPVLRRENASVSSLLIGANDIVQGVPEEVYREHVRVLLDGISRQTGGRMIVLTIPDFSRSPVGKQFGRDMEERIRRFNAIMTEEAEARKLRVLDLHSLSREGEGGLLSDDGLHPSAQAYASWEENIRPVMKEMLS